MVPVGYFIGRPIRRPVMGFMFGVGLLAGAMLASQNACYRLMGLRENGPEVAAIQYRLDCVRPTKITQAGQ